MKLKYLFVCIIILSVKCLIAQITNKNISDSILPGKIILKIKPAYKNYCSNKSIQINNYQEYIQSLGGKINKIFPNAKSPLTEKNIYGNTLVDLSTIYEIYFETTVSINGIIRTLNSLPETEYCQPVYLPELFYSPNDPGIVAQYYLQNIKAYQTWDLCKGDSNIIIGITDTGIENAHEDLIDNIFYNYNDPINGQDDDHDGFVDNFRGWDLGNNDNSPEWDENGFGKNPHGINVSGLAGARTNNAEGIASAGFSCKILPIKISDSTGALIRAYEGIVYAADHGCSVINCSWGGQTKHPYGQDIINYATNNRNALVVAAAGNNGHTVNDVYYPSAYDNVLCVTATNQSDLKWLKSCYGTQVDVCAPGESVYLTIENNGYTFGWGTSYATPIVASCAALVKKWYGDTINAIQLGEILRMTSDNIDTLPGNQLYAGKLGKGRVNLFRAIQDTLPPSVRFHDYQFTSHGGSFIQPGDTVEIIGEFINYLSPTQQLTVTISSTNPHIHFLQSEFSLGVINTMQSISNQFSPFEFYIDMSSDYDEEVVFIIDYNDTLYYDKQYFKFTINPSYTDIDTNRVSVTLTSKGKLGYNNFSPLQGNGFLYNNNGTLLYEGGIAIAQGYQKVLGCFRGKNDFSIVKGISRVIPASPADERWECEFSDVSAGSSKIGLNIKLDAMEWSSPDKSDFVILNYTLINNNSDSITDLYAGIFCDWDIANSFRNKTIHNQDLRLLYSWYTGQTNLYTGMKLLSYENSFHHAFDSVKTLNGNGETEVKYFTNIELYQALSVNRDAAGTSANGNDVASMVSYGPITIAANDSIILSFALLASNSLYNLETSAANAQVLFDSLYISSPEIINETNCFKIFPNPSDRMINILYYSINSSDLNITIYNLHGQLLYSIEKNKVPCGNNLITFETELKKGYYIAKVKTGEKTYSKPLIIR